MSEIMVHIFNRTSSQEYVLGQLPLSVYAICCFLARGTCFDMPVTSGSCKCSGVAMLMKVDECTLNEML